MGRCNRRSDCLSVTYKASTHECKMQSKSKATGLGVRSSKGQVYFEKCKGEPVQQKAPAPAPKPTYTPTYVQTYTPPPPPRDNS